MIGRLRNWVSRTPPEFDDRWRRLLGASFQHWSLLDRGETERMEMLVASFVATNRWEAANGFELTEDIMEDN